jgi:hypothetical protein
LPGVASSARRGLVRGWLRWVGFGVFGFLQTWRVLTTTGRGRGHGGNAREHPRRERGVVLHTMRVGGIAVEAASSLGLALVCLAGWAWVRLDSASRTAAQAIASERAAPRKARVQFDAEPSHVQAAHTHPRAEVSQLEKRVHAEVWRRWCAKMQSTTPRDVLMRTRRCTRPRVFVLRPPRVSSDCRVSPSPSLCTDLCLLVYWATTGATTLSGFAHSCMQPNSPSIACSKS